MWSTPCQCAVEKECLFPPCSFLEPIGGDAVEVTSTDGLVRKVCAYQCIIKLVSVAGWKHKDKETLECRLKL